MRSVKRCGVKSLLAALLAMKIVCLWGTTYGQEVATVQTYLSDARLQEGAAAMQALIDRDESDHNARFSLGMIQFFQAIEGLGQDQYRFGLLAGRTRALPMMRLPVEENPEPEKISYAKAREIVRRFLDGLATAEATLQRVDPANVRLPIHLGTVRLDLNADGEPGDRESIWFITQTLQNPRREANALPAKEFRVVFDAGDVPWLRGYCHALSALGEVILAYDWEDQFERTAHLFYPSVETPYEFLTAEGPGVFFGFGSQNVLDIVAWLHTINYEVAEPERMGAALGHMEDVIELSRQSWELIEAETDDDREWVPNSNQTTVMKGFTVGRDMIAGWHAFLDEMEAILSGKKLVPFWRGIPGGVGVPAQFPVNQNVGINVRKVFTDPQRFDLALWLQGTGLVPFLEEGEIVNPREWRAMLSSFRGRFANYFFWFN